MMNFQNPKPEEANKWISNRKKPYKIVGESITPYKEQLHLLSLHKDEVTSFRQVSLDRKKPTTSLQGRKNVNIKNKKNKTKTDVPSIMLHRDRYNPWHLPG